MFKNCIMFMFLLGMVSAGLAQNDNKLKGIEKEFEKILEVTQAPGFAVAVVHGDKTIYAKGFGYQDLENKIPMNENTLLAIGSTSKAFTCALLGQLKDEGKLSFEDSPIKHVKELKFFSNELDHGINIRDLMSHQTGIPRHDVSWYLFPSYSKDSLIQRIQYHEPFTGLRQKWHYNNFMFLLQGVIAERITGKSWEENIRERFFNPLGMERSNLSIEELEQSTNKAIGYELYKDSVNRKMDYYRIAGMAPAGSINSSVGEMANWLKLWINNGKFNGEQILPESYAKAAMSSQAVISGGLPDKENPDLHMSNYGYGWMISSYRGHYRVEHGGNIDGFSANVAFFPSDSIGIVVLANQNASFVPRMVRNMISDYLLAENKFDWLAYYSEIKEKRKEASEKKESDSQRAKNTKPSHKNISYKGNYFHPGYGTINVSVKGDSLFANVKRNSYYLKHFHYDVFDPIEVTEHGIDTSDTGFLKFNFSTNDAGEISSLKLKLEASLDPIEFIHKPEVIDVDISKLKAYEGEYEVAGMLIKVYTKDDKGLYLFVAGQPEYQLLASDKNLFLLKGLDGYKVKFAEDNTEISLIQPNGTFKAIKK